MSRFLAETLDISRLPPFTLVAADYEQILAARLAGLKVRLAEAGVDYDVGLLETDPLAILEQEDAYRELLERQAINDAGRGLTVAYATGPRLDQVAATFYADIGLRRMDGEGDERFRRRIVLAPEAKSPGTLGGYEYQALSAHLAARDALALNHASGVARPGEIQLVIVAETGADEDEVMAAVRAVVLDREVKLASDTVTVLAATPVVYDVTATIFVSRGPDPALVRAEALARLSAYADERRRAGKVVALSGLDAALHAPSAERVQRTAPSANIDPGPTGVAVLGAVTLTMAVADD